MVGDKNGDVQCLVNNLKNETVIAIALVLVKNANKEGISAEQYTRNYQEKYIEANKDKINPVLEQWFLSQCQDEVINKLRKAIPEPYQPPQIKENSEEFILVGGGSLDWIDMWTSAPEPRQHPRTEEKSCSTVSYNKPNRVFSFEDQALKNIQFVESIITLNEEIEQKRPINTNLLQSLLYDEVEYTSQTHSRNSSLPRCNEFGFSEEFSDGSINFISDSVIKFTLQSSNTDGLINQSVRFIVSFVKGEVGIKPMEVLTNWQGSLVEYACHILNGCSHSNMHCREMMLNLIFELLEDVWNDKRVAQHRQHEMTLYIVHELIANAEICYEILQYISDKLNHLLGCFERKPNDIPKMTEKLAIFINLYCSVVCIISVVKAKCKNKVDTSKCEYSDITNLWQEKWCSRNGDDIDEKFASMIEEGEIQILERLIIHVSRRFPLVAKLAHQALEGARNLKK